MIPSDATAILAVHKKIVVVSGNTTPTSAQAMSV